MGDQTQSWRAGVLLSLAPTLIKHLNQLIKVLQDTGLSSLVTPELIIQYFILLWNML